ncbi:MAG: hypothetical protein AB7D51_00210 [Desulfovibrionaceae bacterium]
MRPFRHSLILALVVGLIGLVGLVGMVGCSTQPGGSADPENFKAELTPPKAPEDPVMEPAPGFPLQDSGGVAELEARLGRAEARLAALESAMEGVQSAVASIAETAKQAMEKAEADPLAGVDLNNDEQVGQVLMQQSLEQIIGISRLLLDKMEDKAAELGAEPSSQAPGQAPAEPAQ